MDTHITIKQEDTILSNIMFESKNEGDFFIKLDGVLMNEIKELKTPTVITITVR